MKSSNKPGGVQSPPNRRDDVFIRDNQLDEYELQKKELARLLASAETEDKRQALYASMAQLESQKGRLKELGSNRGSPTHPVGLSVLGGLSPSSILSGAGGVSRMHSSGNASLHSPTDEEDMLSQGDDSEEEDELLFQSPDMDRNSSRTPTSSRDSEEKDAGGGGVSGNHSEAKEQSRHSASSPLVLATAPPANSPSATTTAAVFATRAASPAA